MTGAHRLVALLLGVATLVAAVAHPAFRNDGLLSGSFVVPVSVSVSFGLVAVAGLSAWTALAGLFVVGQAVALQLVRAGNAVGYQHWLSPGELIGTVAALFPVIQASIVATAYRIGRSRGRFGPLSVRRGWRLLLLVLAFVVTGSALSGAPSAYAAELAVAGLIQAVQLVNLAIVIAWLPSDGILRWRRTIDRILSNDGRTDRPRIDRFALAAAAWVTGVAAVLSWFVYQAHPHIPDEVGYLFQARYFAEGMLAMPGPPVPAAFDLDLMTFEATRWYSPTPPAWPAVLAVGVMAGRPWMVNPLLTGVCLLLAYLFVGGLFGVRKARLVVLLLCVSPWFLYMGSNLHCHQLTLACGLIAALGVANSHRTGPQRWIWLVVSGAALGILAMLRPLEALGLAVLLAPWSMARSPVGGWRRLVPPASLAAVSAAVSSLQLAYNRYLTGNPTSFPLMEYLHGKYGEGSNALGFGANRGFGWTGLDPLPGHGPIDVAINTMLNTFLVNVELLGWSLGSLLPIMILYLFGRRRRGDAIMTTAIIGIVAVHAFYWFSGGPDFGARYWYLILIPCMVLTVRGFETVGEKLGGDSASHARTLAAAALLGLSALTTFMPWRAVDKYLHYRNMRPDIRRLAETHDFGADLVFIRGDRHPDYASAAVYNPIDLGSPVPVYVWDRDPEVTAQVLRTYPDRPVWIVDGPTRTGNGFRVVEGPRPASQVLQDLESER